MVMKKELVLYERDENSELIPKEVPLLLSKKDKADYQEFDKQTISIIPMKRGEIQKMFGLGGKDTDAAPETDKDADGDIIVKYCKNPQFTIEELAYARPVLVRSIVRTIFAESGMTFNDKAGTKRIDKNDEFGKN